MAEISQAIRAALSNHDMTSPLTPAECRTLAAEMEETLVNHECNFSHPDWRYVDGLRATADLAERPEGETA